MDRCRTGGVCQDVVGERFLGGAVLAPETAEEKYMVRHYHGRFRLVSRLFDFSLHQRSTKPAAVAHALERLELRDRR